MALGLLGLGLTLLWALQTLSEYSPLYLVPNASLSLGPLQPDFNHDQFQGRWYAIGVAESNIQNGTESQLDMYSVTFELEEDNGYIATALMLKEDVCEIWTKRLSPILYPGEFTLRNLKDYPIIQSYIVRVVSTDYKNFAVVFLKMLTPNSVYMDIALYGRTKELSSGLKEHFVNFSTSVGLTKDNIIFTDPIERCIDI